MLRDSTRSDQPEMSEARETAQWRKYGEREGLALIPSTPACKARHGGRRP